MHIVSTSRNLIVATIVGISLTMVGEQVSAAGNIDMMEIYRQIAPKDAERTKIIESPENRVLGQGFDSVLGEAKQVNCVHRKASVQPPKPAREDPKVEFSVTAINNERTFSEEMGVRASAAYNSGVSGVSGSVRYLFSNKLNSYSAYAVVSVNVRYDAEQLKANDYEPSAYGKELLRNGVHVFRLFCGDRFVVGYHRGGDFKAIVRASAKTAEERQDFHARFNAWGTAAKGEVKIDKNVLDIEKQTSVNIEVLRHGLDASLPELTFDELIQYARTFTSEIRSRNHKPIFDLIFADYNDVLVAHSKKLEPTPDWAKNMVVQFDHLRSLLRYRADLLYIYDYRDQFVSFLEKTLTRRIDEVSRSIEKIQFWAQECIRTSGAVCEDESAHNLDVPTYAPARTGPKVYLNPATAAWQKIGTTHKGSNSVLELDGQWYYAKSRTKISPVTGSTRIKVENTENAADVRERDSAYRMELPDGYTVSLRFVERKANFYKDNKPVPGYEPWARIGEGIEHFIGAPK